MGSKRQTLVYAERHRDMVREMGVDIWLLLGLVGIGAGCFMVHALLLVRIMRAHQLSLLLRAFAIVPLATPILGWCIGRRWLVVIWSILGLGYLMLFFLSR